MKTRVTKCIVLALAALFIGLVGTPAALAHHGWYGHGYGHGWGAWGGWGGGWHRHYWNNGYYGYNPYGYGYNPYWGHRYRTWGWY